MLGASSGRRPCPGPTSDAVLRVCVRACAACAACVRRQLLASLEDPAEDLVIEYFALGGGGGSGGGGLAEAAAPPALAAPVAA